MVLQKDHHQTIHPSHPENPGSLQKKLQSPQSQIQARRIFSTGGPASEVPQETPPWQMIA